MECCYIIPNQTIQNYHGKNTTPHSAIYSCSVHLVSLREQQPSQPGDAILSHSAMERATTYEITGLSLCHAVPYDIFSKLLAPVAKYRF